MKLLLAVLIALGFSNLVLAAEIPPPFIGLTFRSANFEVTVPSLEAIHITNTVEGLQADFDAEIVYATYPVAKELDLTGKVLVIRRGTMFNLIFEEAQKRGARGVIVISGNEELFYMGGEKVFENVLGFAIDNSSGEVILAQLEQHRVYLHIDKISGYSH